MPRLAVWLAAAVEGGVNEGHEHSSEWRRRMGSYGGYAALLALAAAIWQWSY